MTTKVKGTNIETLGASSFSSLPFLVISNIVYTDASWNPTSNTVLYNTDYTGPGYFILQGSFAANTTVFIDSQEATINTSNSSEIKVVAPLIGAQLGGTLNYGTSYPLFAYQPDGQQARKFIATGPQSISNYLYTFGGYDSVSNYSQITKMDFSNDTSSFSLVGNLSRYGFNFAAAGNFNYSYISGGGGTPYYTSIDKLNYSNETSAVALNGERIRESIGSGNEYYFYEVDGYKGPTIVASTNIVKSEYTSDTQTVAGTTTAVVSSPDAITSLTYMYIIGAGTLTTIRRLDYSNDTSLTIIGNSPLPFFGVSGTMNHDYGWIAGGQYTPTTYVSTIYRIDYANDSNLLSVRSYLDSAKWYQASAGTLDYGYFVGGADAGLVPVGARTTKVERLNYSNDTASTSAGYYALYALQYSEATGGTIG